MNARIRQFVVLACIPLAFSSGLAAAGNPATVTVPPDIEFASLCAIPLDATEQVIRTPGYFLTANADSNRDNLLAKLMGADLKLLENKPGDAYAILEGIQQKVDDWSSLPPKKLKLTESGAAAITSALAGVVSCIHEGFKY